MRSLQKSLPDTPGTLVISTWTLNRLGVYWIPVLWLWFGVRDFLKRGDGLDLSVTLCLATVLVLSCEYWLFGYRVRLSRDHIFYRHRGSPWAKEVSIDRRLISRVEHVYFSRKKGLRSARLRIHVSNRRESIDLFIGSFRPRDIRSLLEWLPGVSSYKQP